MQTLELNRMGLAPMEQEEMQEQNGGFLPVAVVYACWGIMVCCSAVALGMKEAYNEYQKNKAKK